MKEASDWFERRAAMIARDSPSTDSSRHVMTAYNRPKPKPRSYEVTIQGVGLKPLVEAYEATSPGLAKLAALDKYGRWIKVCEVKELKPKAKRNRSSQRAKHRSISSAQQPQQQQQEQPRHLRRRHLR